MGNCRDQSSVRSPEFCESRSGMVAFWSKATSENDKLERPVMFIRTLASPIQLTPSPTISKQCSIQTHVRLRNNTGASRNSVFMWSDMFACVRESSWNPESTTLKLNLPQHDCSVAVVIAQQYSPAILSYCAFVSFPQEIKLADV